MVIHYLIPVLCCVVLWYDNAFNDIIHNRKWQQIEDAQKVAIRDDTVSTIGEGIAEVAAFITEMDLQDNLLWEWEEVCIYEVIPNRDPLTFISIITSFLL